MEAFAMPDARERLEDAVDALVGESIDNFSTHALGADIIDVRRTIDRLEAEVLRRLHRFDRAHGALADGGVSTVCWLRSHCGMTVKAAAYRVHLARTLGELPATLDSARAGRAAFSNVTMIAHLAEDVGVERPGLPLPRMRPPARVDRRPPHHPLVGRWSHRAREPRQALIHPLQGSPRGNRRPGGRLRMVRMEGLRERATSIESVSRDDARET